MSNLLFVGFGGFFGAVLRHIVASSVQSQFSFLGIPVGTVVVNVVGCLLFGFIGTLATDNGILSAQTRLLVFTGFLGSFTTFSTFGNETVALAQGEQFNIAILYVVLKLGLGFSAIVIGQMAGHAVGKYV